MTNEQKFFYDLRGWILIPNVLSSSEIDEMKAEAYACDGSRPLRNSRGYVGSLQKLLDYPAIVGILTEILSDLTKQISTMGDLIPIDRISVSHHGKKAYVRLWRVIAVRPGLLSYLLKV